MADSLSSGGSLEFSCRTWSSTIRDISAGKNFVTTWLSSFGSLNSCNFIHWLKLNFVFKELKLMLKNKFYQKVFFLNKWIFFRIFLLLLNTLHFTLSVYMKWLIFKSYLGLAHVGLELVWFMKSYLLLSVVKHGYTASYINIHKLYVQILAWESIITQALRPRASILSNRMRIVFSWKQNNHPTWYCLY